jgi:hypothetical protein
MAHDDPPSKPKNVREQIGAYNTLPKKKLPSAMSCQGTASAVPQMSQYPYGFSR